MLKMELVGELEETISRVGMLLNLMIVFVKERREGGSSSGSPTPGPCI